MTTELTLTRDDVAKRGIYPREQVLALFDALEWALADRDEAARGETERAVERDAARAERDCFKAARLTWSPEVLAAVQHGDIETCRADAQRRHDNWTTLEAERASARSDLVIAQKGCEALRREVERLTRLIGNARVKAEEAASFDHWEECEARHETDDENCNCSVHAAKALLAALPGPGEETP